MSAHPASCHSKLCRAAHLAGTMAEEPHVYNVTCVAEVWSSHQIVWKPELSSPLAQLFRRLWSESREVVRCLRREGMRHWISGWESVPASYSWAAETPAERARHSPLAFPLSQAFHMSQPSLPSPPGWRKKRKPMLYFSSSCSTSPRVKLPFSSHLFALLFCVVG